MSHDLPQTPNEHEVRIAHALEQLQEMTPDAIVKMAWDDESRTYEFDNDTSGAITELPSANLPFGRAVYTAFAEHPDVEARTNIAYYVSDLTKADRNSGIELWNHLVRDPDWKVRNVAIQLINEAAGAQTVQDPDEHLKDITGLTWYDAYKLHQAYADAAQNRHLYQPSGLLARVHEAVASRKPRFLGSTALARLIGRQ